MIDVLSGGVKLATPPVDVDVYGLVISHGEIFGYLEVSSTTGGKIKLNLGN